LRPDSRPCFFGVDAQLAPPSEDAERVAESTAAMSVIKAQPRAGFGGWVERTRRVASATCSDLGGPGRRLGDSRPGASTSTRSSPPYKARHRGKREESEWCGRATLGVVDAGLVVYRLVFRVAASWAHPEAAWGIRNADPVVCGKRELCSGWGPAAARTTDPEGARLEICGETQFSPRVEAGVLLGHGPQRDYADP
jgi:hypothetical protein